MAVKFAQVPTDLSERIRKLPSAVASVTDIVALWLFGSRARGEATPLSDVDLAYLRVHGCARDRLEAIDRALYRRVVETLGTDEVSLLDVEEAPPHLQMQVLREGRFLNVRDRVCLAGWTERVLRTYPEAVRLRGEVLNAFEAHLRGCDMEIDRERVLDLLRGVERDVGRIREKTGMSLSAYLKDEDARDVVARRFQTSVEGCLNVANHVIARKGLEPAADYASAFLGLSAGGVISPETAEKMADMARFRNLLVHIYWDVDHRRVHRAAPDRIETLEAFVKEMGAFLHQEEEAP